MLVAEEAVEIRVLRRQGKSIREIARMLDVSRNTVRRYLRSEGLPRYEREARPSKLDPYKQYIDERVKAAAPDWIPATVLLRELRALGLSGWLQHPEGISRDAATGGPAGAGDSVRDRTRAPDAGRLRDHPARTRPAGGVHRHARMEPGDLRRVRHR